MIRRFVTLAMFASSLLGIGCANRQEVVQVNNITVHTFRHDYANAYLLVQGPSLVLVDAGLEKNAPALEADILEAGFDPLLIRAVVLTHGHADHAGGARYFKEKRSIPIVAGVGEREMLSSGKNDRLCPTDAIAQFRLDQDQHETYQSTVADIWIDKPRSLADIGGIEGTVLPMPGHTPGSLVVLIPNAAFVGDLFRGSISDFSAERHFFMCDVPDNDADIRSLLGMQPAQTYFTGHFGPVDRVSVEMRFVTGS